MSLKLAARLVVVDPYKIADLQENDVNPHEINISTIVPPECMALLICPHRISGAGSFIIYPRSSATRTVTITSLQLGMAPVKDQVIMWKNSVANDDWDLYLMGYFVQKRTR